MIDMARARTSVRLSHHALDAMSEKEKLLVKLFPTTATEVALMYALFNSDEFARHIQNSTKFQGDRENDILTYLNAALLELAKERFSQYGITMKELVSAAVEFAYDRLGSDYIELIKVTIPLSAIRKRIKQTERSQ
ncbi:hypothetical protein [Thermococcus onnurineus]|uniref:hypothetical protein n=1 Tax=Thermococcus onnurineus TaxID=342948 RepID=UPI0011D047EC|nr:hypothetical protein [Thermococcus onnurineus]